MQSRPSQFFSQVIQSSKMVGTLLLAAGFVVYAPSLNNRFLLDDESQVLHNDLIHSPANSMTFFLGSTMHQEGPTLAGIYYKPIMSLAYSLLWWSSPGDPVPYHVFQLLIVIANAFLVWLLFRRHMADGIALFMSLLFLLHPLNSEVVTYIADLQDALYTLFGLIALNVVAKAQRLNWLQVMGLAGLLLCSMLSKESGILYVVTVVVYAAVYKPGWWKTTLLGGVVSLAAYLSMRLGAAHLTALTFKQNQIGRAPLEIRLLTAPQVLASYLWKFLFPRDLTATQDWVVSQASWNDFWLPLIFALGLLAICVWYAVRGVRRGQVNFAFFTFWVFMGMGFHSHLIVPLDGTVADRWFYFSSIGLIAMIGIWLDQVAWATMPRQLSAAVLAVILAMGLRSYQRSGDWYDNYVLCSHDLKIFANSYDMHNNLGVELFRRGQPEDAKREFERSVELAPGWDINWNNLGAAYNRLGFPRQAEASYLKSMEHGNYFMAYENYVALLIVQGRKNEARAFITERALPLFPASKTLRDLLASLQSHP